jgi:hypothetical protein
VDWRLTDLGDGVVAVDLEGLLLGDFFFLVLLLGSLDCVVDWDSDWSIFISSESEAKWSLGSTSISVGVVEVVGDVVAELPLTCLEQFS